LFDAQCRFSLKKIGKGHARNRVGVGRAPKSQTMEERNSRLRHACSTTKQSKLTKGERPPQKRERGCKKGKPFVGQSFARSLRGRCEFEAQTRFGVLNRGGCRAKKNRPRSKNCRGDRARGATEFDVKKKKGDERTGEQTEGARPCGRVLGHRGSGRSFKKLHLRTTSSTGQQKRFTETVGREHRVSNIGQNRESGLTLTPGQKKRQKRQIA